MALIESLAADLAAETEDLASVLATLDAHSWSTPTPAPGWTIGDQVAHLLVTEHRAILSLTAPEEFAAVRAADLADSQRLKEAMTEHPGDPQVVLLDEFRAARRQFLAAALDAPAGTRLTWYGPDMSLASMLTARLMETWAHGQDIRDTLGLPPSATGRLRHIARIGVATRAFSYDANGLTAPADTVAVVLSAPDGSSWEYGDPTAAHRVEGTALDFCLLVTQRRHVADTSLVATPGPATEWLGLAQAFAGPPGEGRKPGQFAPVAAASGSGVVDDRA